jgi:hypothetical protein
VQSCHGRHGSQGRKPRVRFCLHGGLRAS